jgi:uncharacterized protein (DUF4415 family)
MKKSRKKNSKKGLVPLAPEREHDFSHAVVGKYAKRDVDTKKTCITLYIDNDVLAHLKKRAKKPNAAPYQTQINEELRAVMERDLNGTNAMLQYEKFISTLCEILEPRLNKRRRAA